jgi:molybdenum cofactor synthesis domain-containing protein
MSGEDGTAGSAGRDAAGGPDAPRVVTAALVIIGNEVLSGRTRDANTAYLAERLNALGVRLREVRVVRDAFEAIARAVNELRAENDYVFTTGGIGPTHDDITAEAVARAFGRPLVAHPEALARLERHYAAGDFTPARRRMANTPEGAVLIDNPVSAAPGFQVENVFVLAGVPRIMQAMFESVRHRLVGGEPLISRTVRCNLPEGRIAGRLARLQDAFPDLEIGSYPHMHQAGPSVRLVLRGTDAVRLAAAVAALTTLIAELGGSAEELDITSE